MTWWGWLLCWLAAQPLLVHAWDAFVRWQKGERR